MYQVVPETRLLLAERGLSLASCQHVLAMDHLGWRALATAIMRAKLWHRASFTWCVDKQTFDWLICRAIGVEAESASLCKGYID